MSGDYDPLTFESNICTGNRGFDIKTAKFRGNFCFIADDQGNENLKFNLFGSLGVGGALIGYESDTIPDLTDSSKFTLRVHAGNDLSIWGVGGSGNIGLQYEYASKEQTLENGIIQETTTHTGKFLDVAVEGNISLPISIISLNGRGKISGSAFQFDHIRDLESDPATDSILKDETTVEIKSELANSVDNMADHSIPFILVKGTEYLSGQFNQLRESIGDSFDYFANVVLGFNESVGEVIEEGTNDVIDWLAEALKVPYEKTAEGHKALEYEYELQNNQIEGGSDQGDFFNIFGDSEPSISCDNPFMESEQGEEVCIIGNISDNLTSMGDDLNIPLTERCDVVLCDDNGNPLRFSNFEEENQSVMSDGTYSYPYSNKHQEETQATDDERKTQVNSEEENNKEQPYNDFDSENQGDQEYDSDFQLDDTSSNIPTELTFWDGLMGVEQDQVDETGSEDKPPEITTGGLVDAAGQALIDSIAAEQGWGDLGRFAGKVGVSTISKGFDVDGITGHDFGSSMRSIGISMGTDMAFTEIGEQMGMSAQEVKQAKLDIRSLMRYTLLEVYKASVSILP